jgi:hypothetical protein
LTLSTVLQPPSQSDERDKHGTGIKYSAWPLVIHAAEGHDHGETAVKKGSRSPQHNEHVHGWGAVPERLEAGDIKSSTNAKLHWYCKTKTQQVSKIEAWDELEATKVK